MQLTDYTSYDEVRAALGVSEDELEDVTLSLPMYADVLQIELEDIHVNLPTTYSTISGAATQTDDQRRFLQAAHLFATYAVAKHLASSLPMFAPEQYSDGKASKQLAQSNPHKVVMDNVAREYSRFRSRLDQMFATVNSSSTGSTVTKNFLSVSSPSSNPILGT